jgi:hypothetical protein
MTHSNPALFLMIRVEPFTYKSCFSLKSRASRFSGTPRIVMMQARREEEFFGNN